MNNSRLEILRAAFTQASISHRKKITPEELEQIVDVARETLKNIPTDMIGEVFAYDFQNRTGMRGFPSDRDLLESWGRLRERAHTKAVWNPQDKTNIPEGSYYNYKSLPWCYIPHRLRYLIENQGNLSPDEILEFDEFKQRKWYQGDLKLNETLQEAINISDTLSCEVVKRNTFEAVRRLSGKFSRV